ncbi:MAG: DMT family transporter [Firmicutes bacterium]|nr:DMT family transporter [Bacillota bacterium]
MNLLYLLIAGLAGALMAVQGSLNSFLGEKLGLLPATFSVQLLGALTAGSLLLLCFRGESLFSQLSSVPLYYWLGGPIGVAITYTVAVSIPRLGVGNATTGIIFFQLLTAYLIDHFGLFNQETLPFTVAKAIGVVLMVSGAFLLLKK